MIVGVKSTNENGLTYAGFNQDQCCFACTTNTGFGVFNCDPLKVKVRRNFGAGFKFVEMLFRCNYVALVGSGNNPRFPPNKVIIYDDSIKKIKVELEFTEHILGIRLRRDRIVVILPGIIKVFTFTEPPQQISVYETNKNTRGLCALCPHRNNSLLAFPRWRTGHVEIVNLADNKSPFIYIAAHETNVACIAFNLQGTRLATASEKGTLIRLFDTTNGQKVAELRRGTNQATIYCISFNHDSTYLCVASDHGTIHVFALDDPKLNHVSKFQNTVFMKKYFSSTWSFCKFNIPNGPACVCAFSALDNSINVVCSDGWYYTFKFNAKGECAREYSCNFLDMSDDKT